MNNYLQNYKLRKLVYLILQFNLELRKLYTLLLWYVKYLKFT